MQYLIGSYEDLGKIRAAVDVLAGMPKPELGLEHVLSPPSDLGDGDGLLATERDLYTPYADQDALVDGETIHTPSLDQLLEQDALPDKHQDYLWSLLYPAEFFPNGPPPRPPTTK